MAVSASADTTSALWYCGPSRSSFARQFLPPPGGGEVRVKTLYSAISRGTESLVFGGRVPAGEFQRMRAPFMAGDFPFPVNMATPRSDGSRTAAMPCADKNVFALHPHQTAFNIPRTQW